MGIMGLIYGNYGLNFLIIIKCLNKNICIKVILYLRTILQFIRLLFERLFSFSIKGIKLPCINLRVLGGTMEVGTLQIYNTFLNVFYNAIKFKVKKNRANYTYYILYKTEWILTSILDTNYDRFRQRWSFKSVFLLNMKLFQTIILLLITYHNIYVIYGDRTLHPRAVPPGTFTPRHFPPRTIPSLTIPPRLLPPKSNSSHGQFPPWQFPPDIFSNCQLPL